MAGVWRYGGEGPKYLVQRRDGTVPAWPWFVLGAADPCAPVALRAYADACQKHQMDPVYVADLRRLADEFGAWYAANPKTGDPDAGRHRTDDPATVAKMTDSMGA